MCISEISDLSIIKKVHLPAIMLLYSPQCPHCVHFHPEYIKISHSNHGIPFISINIDNLNKEQVETLNIQGIPDLRFINKRGKIAKYNGDRKEQDIMNSFENFIN